MDEVSENDLLSLRVVDVVTQVSIIIFEDVENWENLSVVGDQGFTNHISTQDKSLESFEHNSDNIWLSGVQSSFDWNDELRNNWENLRTSLFKQIISSEDG